MKGILLKGLALSFLAFAMVARADVRLPAIFSDHMVVQSGASVMVWGWGEPAENVFVSLAGQSATAHTNEEGKWRVKLKPLSPSAEPQTLTVKGRNTVTVSDVLIGEVWLCSGQSNMEMQLKGLHGQVVGADQEISAADFPQIRMFVHDQVYDIYELPVPPPAPVADRPGTWIVCSPRTAARFTAIGYFFGRELHRELKRPIGIVHSSVGGTPIEAWTSLEAQQAAPALRPVLDDWQKRLTGYDPERELNLSKDAQTKWEQQGAAERRKTPAKFRNLQVSTPAGLFNSMIAPLVPYTIRGVLWYQGEKNAGGPLTRYYGLQLQTLIRDWRARWGEELYFAWVQLPNYQKEQQSPSEADGWGVAVRDGMRKTLALPRTAMAITIDLGGVTAGHPANKAPFAHRLALAALHDVYDKPIAVWSGPVFRSVRRDGTRMALTFDHGAGLKPRSGELRGFAIAGRDRKFVWARAWIENDTVIASSDEVKEPAAVRYAWAANPIGNLVNAANLPASPFRTDEW